MNIVYLGWLDSILEWVFDHILSPITNWLGGILETLFDWAFRNILEPVLVKIFIPLLKELAMIVYRALAYFFFTLLRSIFYLLDAIQTAFNVFSGLQKVNVGADGKGGEMLLTYLFRQGSIQRIFWSVAVVSFVLILFFTILATLRSMADIDEMSRPVGKVLRSTMRSFIRVIMIPAAAFFGILLSGALLGVIARSTALSGGKNVQSLANIIFVTASLDAVQDKDFKIDDTTVKGKEYNVSTASAANQEKIATTEDIIRQKYYNYDPFVSLTDKETNKNYLNCRQSFDVEKYFDITKIDYFIGLGSGIFCIIVMLGALLIVLNRLFEVLILYIISPFFAAVMPLDDGEKFKAWQDLFIGKIFGGLSTVLVTNVYFLLIPMIMSGSVRLAEGSAEANYLMKVFFVLGGGWAMYKTGPMITMLLSEAAGRDELASAQAGMAIAKSAGNALVKIGKAAAGGFNTGFKLGGQGGPLGGDDGVYGGGGGGSSVAGADAAFTGLGSRGGSRSGGPGGSGGGLAAAMGALKAGKGDSFMKAVNGKKDAVKAPLGSKENPIQGAPRIKPKKGFSITRIPKRDKNGNITGYKNHFNLNLGGLFQKTTDSSGKSKFSILGMGFTKRNGKIDSFKVPFAKFKRNANGEFKCTKANVLGLAKVKANVNKSIVRNPDGSEHVVRDIGSRYLSDVSAIGLHRKFNETTGQAETTDVLGFSKRSTEDGSATQYSFMGHEFYGSAKFQNEDGSTLESSRLFGGDSFTRDVTTSADGMHTSTVTNAFGVEHTNNRTDFGDGTFEETSFNNINTENFRTSYDPNSDSHSFTRAFGENLDTFTESRDPNAGMTELQDMSGKDDSRGSGFSMSTESSFTLHGGDNHNTISSASSFSIGGKNDADEYKSGSSKAKKDK